MSTFERWFLPLIAIFLLVAVLVKEVAAHTLTSDSLDPRTTSVIITVNGVDDPTCGPGAAPCIGDGNVIRFDVSALQVLGQPFTVSARACAGADNCSTDSQPVTLDPATFSLHRVTGIVIIEL